MGKRQHSHVPFYCDPNDEFNRTIIDASKAVDHMITTADANREIREETNLRVQRVFAALDANAPAEVILRELESIEAEAMR